MYSKGGSMASIFPIMHHSTHKLLTGRAVKQSFNGTTDDDTLKFGQDSLQG